MRFGGYFDFESKKKLSITLEQEINSSNFWSDTSSAEQVVKKFNSIKNDICFIENLRMRVTDNLEILNDVEMLDFCCEELISISKDYEELRLSSLLNGEYDDNNCIIDIHAGAGGTESCDWVMMLYRMYERYASDNGFKFECLDILSGDEAGYKSVSFMIKGKNAYGYLQAEKGVHRLIRISPFDSNSRRHTSFASVDVIPEFDNNINISIKEEDLKIDVYRSSGAGGQSVNTTDSAVRITHIPTNTVVTCQNERSQIKNKEKALSVLKSKLYKLELENQEEKLKGIQGDKKEINFGSQIRTYTLHPYSLVKDHRTNYEDANVIKVLDGNINKFIEEYLKLKLVNN